MTARRSIRSATWKRVVGLLGALFVTSSGIEVHAQTHQHRDLALGQTLEKGAIHPGIPHHFDRSEQRREPACAACARQAQNHGVQPAPTGRIEAAQDLTVEPPHSTSAALPSLSFSASPRGPPAS